MAVFRIIPGQQYTGNGMIAYIYNKEIHDGMIIPFSVGADPANGYTDFMLTKLLYNKPGGVQYKQFMLSLTQKETIDDFYNRGRENFSSLHRYKKNRNRKNKNKKNWKRTSIEKIFQ